MLKILDLRDLDLVNLGELLPRPQLRREEPVDLVRQIIHQVRELGDEALVALTKQYDGVELSKLVVEPSEVIAAYERIDPELRSALHFAFDAIVTLNGDELRRHYSDHSGPSNGHVIHTKFVPVERAGCYVPGGRARYPSSVIMTAGIAKVAGVSEVVVCVPPGADGRVDDATLAACHICSVDVVVAVGGAQAIAAMAYGTTSVPKVDVIVGPGNTYVSLAKREVSGVVGVPSSFAGPSEVVVIADRSTPPLWAAVDVAVQAEHGPEGLAWLITWDLEYAEAVASELNTYVESSPRADQIRSTLEEGGYAVVVSDREAAHRVSNFIAPEHLELLYEDPSRDYHLITAAGAVFAGVTGTAAFGDYVAGPSHVLPTFGTARFASVLSVVDFLKRLHIVEVGEGALGAAAEAGERLARSEGLEAHRYSLELRRSASL
jgi:histidinol dehydrogenase